MLVKDVTELKETSEANGDETQALLEDVTDPARILQENLGVTPVQLGNYSLA